jgi:hypothetical protein
LAIYRGWWFEYLGTYLVDGEPDQEVPSLLIEPGKTL